MTEPKPLQQCDRTFVRVGARKLSYFSGCDYFRMASQPSVIRAFKRAADQFGLNVAASRFTTGNHRAYRQLERELTNFFGVSDALLVSAGYLTNLVVAQGLCGSFSHAILDERAHPSLQDAAGFFNCPVLLFRHQDVEDFTRCIARCGPQSRVILLTDGMFSHDGSVAPLRDYVGALPKDGWILVDDAHGAGVIGAHGRGSPEHCGISRRRIVQTITLSKGFGSFGGAILCPESLRETIISRSHLLIGCTPMPPPNAAAAVESLRLLRTDSRRRRLHENTRRFRARLRSAGIDTPENPGPIVGLIPGNATIASCISAALLKGSVYPPFIKYPGAPEGGYFRFVISSEHSPQQLDTLAELITQALRKGDKLTSNEEV